jgi:hypothetical protein
MLVLLRTVAVGIKPERIDYGHAFRLSLVLQVRKDLATPSSGELMGVQSCHPNLLAS